MAGVLTYQGQPLGHYQITLLPVDGRRPAVGVTDAAGKFTMGTNRMEDGAPPGTNRVVVVFVGPPSASQPGQETPIDDPALLPKPEIEIPEKYGQAETTDLTIDIPNSGILEIEIELE